MKASRGVHAPTTFLDMYVSGGEIIGRVNPVSGSRWFSFTVKPTLPFLPRCALRNANEKVQNYGKERVMRERKKEVARTPHEKFDVKCGRLI